MCVCVCVSVCVAVFYRLEVGFELTMQDLQLFALRLVPHLFFAVIRIFLVIINTTSLSLFSMTKTRDLLLIVTKLVELKTK